MECSIVIPVRNEYENIPLITHAIEENLKDYTHEIIFVNDGSTDNSEDVLQNMKEKYPSVISFKRQKEGKITVGKALKLGIDNAKGIYVVVMDGDLSHDPKYIPILLNGLKRYDVVVASRFMEGGGQLIPFSFKKKICYFIFSILVRSLTRISVADFSHGFKAMKRDIFKGFSIECDDFAAYTEIAIKAYVLGHKIGEVPVFYGTRNKGESKFNIIKTSKGYIALLWWIVKQKWK